MRESLMTRISELRDLQGAIGLLNWDQETYLPRRGDEARSAQLATLQSIYHERLSDGWLGEEMEACAANSSDEQAMLRVLAWERNRALRIPARLVKAVSEAQSAGLTAWRTAREQQALKPFSSPLATLVSLRREQADAWGHEGERYDALLEGFEPGMRVARLTPVLERLRAQLVPVVERLTQGSRATSLFENHQFAEQAQFDFTFEILRAMGFDFERGRQDKSVHPFTSGNHPHDIRITTRIFEQLPLSSIFSSIHEGGHGLYEQGFVAAHVRTPLAQAPSMGLHESQSRLWENIVGRSEAFWISFLPRFNRAHGTQFLLPEFLNEVCRVEKSLIRVEADEVTYNLHIVLRYELELALMRGTLEVQDLEEAWNAKTKSLLGQTVTTVGQGVLQDIHWAWGEFGYFPTYALGNLYAASIWKALEREIPHVQNLMSKGDLSPIKQWLNQKIHAQGFRYDAESLVRQVTGQGLTDVDFMAAIHQRYAQRLGSS
jgi:carboxypeptidase Taq